MTASDNKIIDMIMKYLSENSTGVIEASYFNKWDSTAFDEIQECIGGTVNIHTLYDYYPELSLEGISADTLLEIQKVVIDEYEFGLVGDVLHNKNDLLTLYMGSGYVADIITKKYDIIKIQRLWRGYDCRWKNPFLMLRC